MLWRDRNAVWKRINNLKLNVSLKGKQLRIKLGSSVEAISSTSTKHTGLDMINEDAFFDAQHMLNSLESGGGSNHSLNKPENRADQEATATVRFSLPLAPAAPSNAQPAKSTAKRLLFNLITGGGVSSSGASAQAAKPNKKKVVSIKEQKQIEKVQKYSQSRRLSDFHRPTKVSDRFLSIF